MAIDPTTEHSSADFETTMLFSNVLLVEDDPAHAKLLSRTLAPFVGEITHVLSGETAIRSIESQFFELVLCDLNLPDVSGMDLLRTIHSARPDLPVIVMTSSSSLEDSVSAMREGAWDYMVKEFSDDLKVRMQFVIQRAADRKIRELRELRVRAERDAFSAAVYTAPDGLAILGSEGLIVFSNEAFNEFRQTLTKAGVAHRAPGYASINVVELITPHDESVAAAFRQQLQSRSDNALWTSELKVQLDAVEGAKPEIRYFELSLSSVANIGLDEAELGFSPGVEMRRYVVWAKDITRRKDQEKFQRDLLSTTSHDLKGPLGAILTSAELIGDYASTDTRVQELATRVGSCARNSINLIDELLSARRIQDGVFVVKPHNYDVGEFLEDTVLDYIPMARAKNISLRHRPLLEPVNVFADKIALHRVLGNLVSNAIKFTPKGGDVELWAEHHGEEVRISVTDTGAGIEPKNRRMLFERYSRLEKHQEIEGSGLGLYVTKNIVDAHNGRVELSSEVDKGSTFTVVFPDKKAVAE